MHIEITREEYATLLDLVYIAQYVLTGHKTGQDTRTAAHDRLIQKLYSRAAEMDRKDSIEYDSDLEKYLPTAAMRSSLAGKFIDGFTDAAFWHVLIERFTLRDLERSMGGPERLRALKPEERFGLETPFEEKYIHEFEQHGIERLEIVERFDVNGGTPKTSD